MDWQLTPYGIILIAGSGLIVFLAALAWQRWEAVTGSLYGLLMLAIVVWTLGQVMELAVADPAAKILWAKVQYVGIVNVPPLWALFLLSYINGRWRPGWRTVALLWLEPVVTLILVFTTQYNQFLWTEIAPGPADVPFLSNGPILVYGHGPWYWIRNVWIYLLIIAADVWLIRAVNRMPRLHRRQTWLLVIAAQLPPLSNIAYSLALSPIPGMDYTSLGFIVGAVLLSASVLEFRLFDLLPVARSLLIERLSEGLLVLDARDRVVDINPAAQRFLGVDPAAVLGERLDRAIGDRHSWARLRQDEAESVLSFTVEDAGAHYDVTISPLHDRRGRRMGRLIALHDVTAHKRAEAALRASEERFRTLLEHAPIGISLNRGGYALYVNPAYARMYGYDNAGDLENIYLPDHVAPESRGEIVARMQARERGETVPGNYEAVGMRKDGSPFPYHVEVAHIRLPDGMANLAFHLDITNLRQAEAAERDQRILAEALRDSTAAINATTLDVQAVLDRILENVGRVVPHQAAEIMLIEGDAARVVSWRGYPPESAEFFSAAEFSLDMPTLREMIETGQYCLVASAETDERWTSIPQLDWIHSYLGVPIETRTQIIGFLSLVNAASGFFTPHHAERLRAFADQAATALEKAQLFESVQRYSTRLEQLVYERTAELEHGREQLKAILDAINEGVLHDDFSRVEYVNPAFTRLTGYSAGEVIGFPLDILRLLAPAERDQIAPALDEAVQHSSSWQGEVMAQRKDGTQCRFEITITVLRDSAGQPTSKVYVFRDLTAERNWQTQKSRFISHAAHELRTPITVFKTSLYLLRRRPEWLDRQLDVMEPVAEQMTALVEELLEMTRLAATPTALDRRVMPLQDVVAQMEAALRYTLSRSGVDLVKDLAADPLYVFADIQTLGRALSRLLSNALNVTPPGSQIEVSVLPDESSTHALLRIHDGAEIVPADLLAQLFEPFFRTSEGSARGSGLGLTIARQIVELHGGTITATTEPGRGIIIEIQLPLVVV